MTELRIEAVTLSGARLGEENPLPFFRDPAKHRRVKVNESVPAEKRDHLGWETAFRVLPYRMQDQYTRQREAVTFQGVVLENEILKATFLPQVGGRLISLVHKPLGRELLHRNPVFQPANLAIRNAWFSGGIEWNIGQYGHTFFTCAPVFAAAIEGPEGEPGLRLYEFERCKRLLWQIDFSLPPGSPFLAAYTRVINPNDEASAMYWWTNIAVNEGRDVRVLAPARKGLYAAFEKEGIAFGLTEMPGLPSLDGADGTYSLHSTFANEFFFQCDETDMPWEAALDGQGSGLVEASTERLKYRKLFCWGTHAGGRHWQSFLAQPGEAYIEIQGGLAPTQIHGLPMPGKTAWDWTQVFGYLEADAEKVHGADWETARQTVDEALKAKLPSEALYRLEAASRAKADCPSEVILQMGSGWGALEQRRRQAEGEDFPQGLVFPEATLGADQAKWLALLEHGALPETRTEELPGEWMVQPEWQERLEESAQTGKGRNWYALLHLGVMRLEQLDEAGAEAAWQESLRLKPSAWAYRNLAVLRMRQKQHAEATAYYEQAWQEAEKAGAVPTALAVEYLQMLVETEQFERGMQVYRGLKPEAQGADRIQILRGQCALEVGDLEAVEEVLARDYAVVREGETVLTDLWFELQARREAERSGRELDETLRKEAQRRFPPPTRIDFRSVD